MKLASQIFLFCALGLGLSAANRAFADCQTQINPTQMDQVVLQYARKLVDDNNAIVILPFFDNSTTKKDPLLATSMPYAFYDFLGIEADSIVHPFVAMQAVSDLSFSDAALAQQSTAMAIAKQLQVRFVIYGSVQRTLDDQMRFFISIFDQKKNSDLYPSLQFATPLNDLFFENLKIGLQSLAKRLSIRKSALDWSGKIPKLQAFRYYAKGLDYARSYDEGSLNLAVVWFEKALKESYYAYPDAAREMARSHLMLALLYRLTNRSPSENWVQAQKLWHDFAKINKTDPAPKDRLTARLIDNQDHFVSALNFYKANQKGRAQKEAKLGLKATPEDGQMAWLLTLSGGKIDTDFKTDFVCFE